MLIHSSMQRLRVALPAIDEARLGCVLRLSCGFISQTGLRQRGEESGDVAGQGSQLAEQ